MTHHRIDVLGAMVGLLQGPDGGWCAFGYSNAAPGQAPDLALPPAGPMAEALARALAERTRTGARQAEVVLWAVNPALRERALSGTSRHVFRLEQGAQAGWRHTQDEEPRLREWEGELLRREQQPIRELAAREDAVVRRQGFLAKADGGGVLCRLDELERVTGVPRLWLFLPRELSGPAWVLRPWNLWIHPDHEWRPEREAALTSAVRATVVARVAGWLEAEGHRVRVVATLPDAADPIRFARVAAWLPQTVLAFLHALGMSPPRDRRFRWRHNQGGELNAAVTGPIPVERVLRAFQFPDDPRGVGAVAVTPEKIEAGGGDLWVATIWSTPAASSA
jgi:hypothetical protein